MFNATIKGRLGSDPEMRYTKGGPPVVNLSVAHNWLYHDERLVKWIRCSVWGELAETANTTLQKGDLVQISGTVSFRTWTREDGKRSNYGGLDLIERSRWIRLKFLKQRSRDFIVG